MSTPNHPQRPSPEEVEQRSRELCEHSQKLRERSARIQERSRELLERHSHPKREIGRDT